MGIDMTPNPNTHDATVCALKIDIKEEDKERLVLNIRTGDFDRNLLNDDIIKEVEE